MKFRDKIIMDSSPHCSLVHFLFLELPLLISSSSLPLLKPSNLGPQTESGNATASDLLPTTNASWRCQACGKKKQASHFSLDFLYDFFQFIIYTPTTPWLILQPPGLIWRLCYFHPGVKSNKNMWWEAHGENTYIIYLSWWCRDLIFFFALVDYSTPRLYMEIRSCCPAADSRTDRDSQWMVRKKSTIFISTLLFVFFLFTWISYIPTLYWLMSQPPDRIWKHTLSSSPKQQ